MASWSAHYSEVAAPPRPVKPGSRAPDRTETDTDFQWPPASDEGQIVWFVDAPPLETTPPPARSSESENAGPASPARPRTGDVVPRRVSPPAKPVVHQKLTFQPISHPAVPKLRADAVAPPDSLSVEPEIAPPYLAIGSRSLLASPYALAVRLSLIFMVFLGSYELSQVLIKGRRANPTAAVQPFSSPNVTAIALQPLTSTSSCRSVRHRQRDERRCVRPKHKMTVARIAPTPVREVPVRPSGVISSRSAAPEPAPGVRDPGPPAHCPLPPPSNHQSTSAPSPVLETDVRLAPPAATAVVAAGPPSSSSSADPQAAQRLRTNNATRPPAALRAAHESLDARGAKEVWPEVDERSAPAGVRRSRVPAHHVQSVRSQREGAGCASDLPRHGDVRHEDRQQRSADPAQGMGLRVQQGRGRVEDRERRDEIAASQVIRARCIRRRFAE